MEVALDRTLLWFLNKMYTLTKLSVYFEQKPRMSNVFNLYLRAENSRKPQTLQKTFAFHPVYID